MREQGYVENFFRVTFKASAIQSESFDGTFKSHWKDLFWFGFQASDNFQKFINFITIDD